MDLVELYDRRADEVWSICSRLQENVKLLHKPVQATGSNEERLFRVFKLRPPLTVH